MAPIPATVAVRVRYELAGAPDSYFTMGYGITFDSLDQTKIDDLAVDDLAFWNLTDHRDWLADAFTVRSVRVDDLSALALNPAIAANGSDQLGGVSGTALPLNVALVASLYTATPGRRFRGRMYFAGFASSAGDGVWASQATRITNIKDSVDDLLVAHGSLAAGRLSVASVTGGFSSPVTSVIVNNLWDTQQRRLSP